MTIGDRVEQLRLHLASSQAVLAVAALGLVSGVVSALVIVGFRLLIESAQAAFIPDGDPGRFESLSVEWRFCLPLVGAVVIALIWRFVAAETRRVGIVHVLERLQYHEGHMPLRNLLVQFLGGAVAMVSGQSVGREAPSIHLGAGISSYFGQKLRLPNNSIRTLVACGTAAAIAASFNTPLAGVIFAMEVVMMEYTITGFTPVIIASVAATIVTRAVFGAASVFFLPQLDLASLWELTYILAMGISIGALSAFFVAAIRYFSRLSKRLPTAFGCVLAGLMLGVIATQIPEVLGMGYDTVNAAVLGDIALHTLALLCIAKLIATAACVGVGIPGGIIGPSLVIGAMVGGIFAYGSQLLPGFTSGFGLYVMLGMGAMMSATLHAPLAALATLFELTANPYLILPAMLAIVSANITAREFFHQESIFSMLLRDAGFDLRNDPVAQSLRRVGVAAVMNRNFVECDETIAADAVADLLAETPQWIIIRRDDGRRTLLPASDLARLVADDPPPEIALLEIPAQRMEMSSVHLQATLHEARKILDESGVDAAFVVRPIAPLTDRTFGVVVRGDIEGSYSL